MVGRLSGGRRHSGAQTMSAMNRSLKWWGPILALALALVIVLNPDGWGAFILDLIIPFVVQAVIALLLFGLLLAFSTGFKDLLTFSSWRRVLLGMFSIATVLALLFSLSVFHRPVDAYDALQTIALIIVFNFLVEPFGQFLRRLEPRSRERSPVVPPTRAPARPISSVESELHQQLLRLVMGDRETAERLIEYERRRAPNESKLEWTRSAIDRWERDNR